MLAQVTSAAVLGIDAYLVTVEVDLARGLPAMAVVGLAESSVREGRERVTAALVNTGFAVPARRITVNLAPADIRKDGSAFDLPIAAGLLAAMRALPATRLDDCCLVGELGLDGEIRPVRGILSIAERCARERIASLIVPLANAAEAAAIGGVTVYAASTLRDVVEHMRGVRPLPVAVSRETDSGDGAPGAAYALDLADIKGQDHARRALEIAAAGQHNVVMVGPPGAGKSMLARRLPGIMPPLTRAEALEVTKVHSVAGRLPPRQALLAIRPFRAPHHTVSDAGLIGGGAMPRPGEVSLAHHGVLFLDELPEFRRHVLDALRQPLEDGVVHIGRARFGIAYPARCMLVAAMNPCPCGFHGAGDARCICNAPQIARYLGRVSGPLLDRIDLHIEVAALSENELLERRPGESSERVRMRVLAARDRQLARFAAGDSSGDVDTQPAVFANAQMSARDVRRWCEPDADAVNLLRTATRRLALSARAFHRVLRVARTIADLDGAERIQAPHVAEAIQYRSIDRVRAPYAAAGSRGRPG